MTNKTLTRCLDTRVKTCSKWYHLNNPGECRSEWYSDQPDYQSGLQMPQLFEKILQVDVPSPLCGAETMRYFYPWNADDTSAMSALSDPS